MLRSGSNVKSLREKVPSSRALLSHTGICGVLPAPTNQPTEELAGAVGCISGETLRLEPHSLLGPLDHCPGGGDLVVGSRRRGLDIHNDGVLDVDQIVEPVAELHALICFRGPCRARVA